MIVRMSFKKTINLVNKYYLLLIFAKAKNKKIKSFYVLTKFCVLY